MADRERIKRDIEDIAGRPKNVRFEEIARVVDQLGKIGFQVSRRRANETILFTVAGQRFGVCAHNPGSGQIKQVYVKEFLKVMTVLDLYED